MKQLGLIILLGMVGLGLWYFVIKKDDYQISFHIKASPQETFYSILNLEKWGDSAENNVQTYDSLAFDRVQQKITLVDTVLNLEWQLKSLNDSITKVSVGIYSGKHSFINKLGVLTGETDFTKGLKKEFTRFRSSINSFARTYRIRIDSVVQTPALHYFYVNNKAGRSEKAMKMIASNGAVYPVIGKFRAERDGYPFIKVNSWNQNTDSINFDFGFPIRKMDSVPRVGDIKYGELKPFKALKATFFGNYSKSDRAWFVLQNYARKQGIAIKNEPLEIFYHNPMEGGDDKQWKAEVFMPVID